MADRLTQLQDTINQVDTIIILFTFFLERKFRFLETVTTSFAKYALLTKLCLRNVILRLSLLFSYFPAS